MILALLFIAAVRPQAQQPPAPAAPAPAAAPGPAAPGLSILVVDVQSLLQNSKSAKMVRQQIEQKRGEYTKEISHQEEVLRQERDTLQRQQASLSADALNQKAKDFQTKVNDLDRRLKAMAPGLPIPKGPMPRNIPRGGPRG